MAQIQYSIKYRKNEGLVMSPQELLALYFYGIQIKAQDGSDLSDDVLRFQIRAAQQEVEKYLEIRLQTKLVEHSSAYYRDDYWNSFPVIKTKLPVKKPLSLIGLLNNIEQITYPKEWLNSKKDSEGNYYKKINIIPTSAVASGSAAVIMSGITAYVGMQGLSALIPDYFTAQYLTGFDQDKIPYDVVDLVGKYAAIRVFELAGDIVLGQGGLSSISLGIDGLSQSISTTNSSAGSAYSARIKMYLTDIDNYMKRLKNMYRTINFTAL
jgi:hypothetical protein